MPSTHAAPLAVPVKTSVATGHRSEARTEPPTPPPDAGRELPSLAGLQDGLSQELESDAPQTEAATPKTQGGKPPAATKPPPATDEEPQTDDDTDLEAALAGKGKPDDKVEEADGDESDTTEAPPAPIPSGPKALRELVARERERAAGLERELKELRTKSEQHATLNEQLETLRKTNDEAEARLRVLDYERSSEYATKFQKPLEQAWQQARTETSELYVDDGQGNRRQAKAEDFDRLLSLNTGDAILKAKELFGDAATEVLAHRRKLIDLSKQAQSSVTEWREHGATLAKQQQAEAAATRERIDALWNETLDKTTKQYPQLFGETKDDTEGNRLLARGVRDADEAMGDLSALTPEQRITVHARIRNRAAAWPREVWRRQQAERERDEALAELAQYRSSRPGKGQSATKEATPESVAEAAAPSGSLESLLGEISKLAG